jgi:hypothetical protein
MLFSKLETKEIQALVMLILEFGDWYGLIKEYSALSFSAGLEEAPGIDDGDSP